jgi:hypothetical protein
MDRIECMLGLAIMSVRKKSACGEKRKAKVDDTVPVFHKDLFYWRMIIARWKCPKSPSF